VFLVCNAAPCGLQVVRIDPLFFLAGCRKMRLNQALSVLSLSLDFSSCAVNFCIVLFCVICVFYLLVVLVRLSAPVQVIDWNDLYMLMGMLNPTHSLISMHWKWQWWSLIIENVWALRMPCKLHTLTLTHCPS